MILDDQKDFINQIDLTLEEARDLDIDEVEGEEGGFFTSLMTLIDEAQGQVFSGEAKVAYVLIAIKASEEKTKEESSGTAA